MNLRQERTRGRLSGALMSVAALVGAMALAVLPAAPAAAAAPANDDFPGTAISGASGQDTSTTLGATAETGQPMTGVPSIWWAWTAPESGWVSFDTCLGDALHTTSLSVWVAGSEPASVGDLASVSQFDSTYPCWSGGAYTSFEATADTVYYVAVTPAQNVVNDEGPVVLRWYMPSVPPSNDTFPGATLNDASGEVTGSTVGATTETDEAGLLAHGLDQTVWWTWTAPATGMAVFDASRSGFWPIVIVYTDGGTTPSVSDLTTEAASPTQATINATEGTTYRIQVSTKTGQDPGTVALRWSMPSPPGNDNLPGDTLTGESGTVSGTTLGATIETDEDDWLGDNTVWWSWTAPVSGQATFDTFGSDFDTRIGIFTGDAFPLTWVGENDDATFTWLSKVTFTATAGTVYRIGVGGYPEDLLGNIGQMGNVTLNWLMAVGTTTDLSDSPSGTSLVGEKVTYTATVTPSAGGTLSGGTVAFTDGSTPISGCDAVAVDTTTGEATCEVTYTVTGSHTVTAAYSGYTGSLESTSDPVTHVVQTTTTTSLADSPAGTSAVGAEVTYTATITPGWGNVMGGTVAFTDDSTPITGCAAVPVNNTTGQAACKVTYTAIGSHSVTATYSGITTIIGSSSDPITHEVQEATTTTSLSASPSEQSLVGATVTYTATVTPSGGKLSGGTVSFTDDSTPITDCSAAPVDTTTGQATCQVTYNEPGTHSVTASYSGSTGFTGSSSDPLTHQVTYGTALLARTVTNAGRTLTVKVQFTDSSGTGVAGLTATVTGITPDAAGVWSGSQPSGTLTESTRGKKIYYGFDLLIPEDAAGGYNLHIEVQGDPVTHDVPVTVRVHGGAKTL